jgi:hypothetical protein
MSHDEQGYQKGSSCLTGGSVLYAQESFVLWLEASEFQEVILIERTYFLCHETVTDEFDSLKFEILR